MTESVKFTHRETFTIGEADYSIFEKPCDDCGEPLHMLGRFCNLKATTLALPCGYDLDAAQALAESLEESFHFASGTMLKSLMALIDSISGPGGAYFNYADEEYELVRLADSARRALSFFAKERELTELEFKGSEPNNCYQAAFMLGYLASDHEWTTVHADALHAGYSQQEAQERGGNARREARAKAVEQFRSIAVGALIEFPQWGRSAAIGKGIQEFAKEVRRRALTEPGDNFMIGKKPLSVKWFKQETGNAKAEGVFETVLNQGPN